MNEIEQLREEVEHLKAYIEALKWFEYVVMNFHTLNEDQISELRRQAQEHAKAQYVN